jgi:hypothetical protein
MSRETAYRVVTAPIALTMAIMSVFLFVVIWVPVTVAEWIDKHWNPPQWQKDLDRAMNWWADLIFSHFQSAPGQSLNPSSEPEKSGKLSSS